MKNWVEQLLLNNSNTLPWNLWLLLVELSISSSGNCLLNHAILSSLLALGGGDGGDFLPRIRSDFRRELLMKELSERQSANMRYNALNIAEKTRMVMILYAAFRIVIMLKWRSERGGEPYHVSQSHIKRRSREIPPEPRAF